MAVSFDDLKLCKFKCDDIQVIFRDGSTDTILAMNISSFKIEKDFLKNFLPIFEVQCTVDYDLYRKINKEDCKFKLNFSKFFIPSNNETTYDKRNLFLKNFINDIFVNINSGDNTPDMTNDLGERSGKDLEQPNKYQKSQIDLDLFLFLEEALDYTKLNNNIFKDINILDTIMAMATVTEQRKMMLALPDNRIKKYDTIPIPNDLTFLGAMEYLQSVYGIYNKSLIIFNDFDYLYILDKDVKCKAYRNSEIIKIYINYYEITDAKGNINGQYEGYNYYEISSTEKPGLINSESQMQQLLGSSVSSVNTKTGNTNNIQYKDTKILDNKYNNPYAENSFNYEKSFIKTISTKFKNIDPSIFKLNKEYYFQFNTDNSQYLEYNGQYKLIYLNISFNKSDEEIFENVIEAKFTRA